MLEERMRMSVGKAEEKGEPARSLKRKREEDRQHHVTIMSSMTEKGGRTRDKRTNIRLMTP